jgi:hypothetical protein
MILLIDSPEVAFVESDRLNRAAPGVVSINAVFR